VTHDLAVAAQIADDVIVMYAGRIVESGTIGDVVHALPVLTALRRRFPTAHIAWVVNRAYEPLPATAAVPFCAPDGLCLDEQGARWVADSINSRQDTPLSRACLTSFSSKGSTA